MKPDEVAACRRVDVFLIKSAPAVLKRRQAALNFTFAMLATKISFLLQNMIGWKLSAVKSE